MVSVLSKPLSCSGVKCLGLLFFFEVRTSVALHLMVLVVALALVARDLKFWVLDLDFVNALSSFFGMAGKATEGEVLTAKLIDIPQIHFQNMVDLLMLCPV